MSLTKIPLLVSNAAFFWLGATPPKVDAAPSPVKVDKVQMGGLERVFGQFIPYIARLFKSPRSHLRMSTSIHRCVP
ncbi:hypothetical protein OF83DRAFT_896952 [Amylostereum chailletii]|nr:hypothetical protein OF83DRAFT_896952 [Amylostereum chailletii]